MKIITANIPRIIVGIVQRILKIVKLLLFLSSPFVTEAPHLCSVSEVSLDWDPDLRHQTQDNGDIISTLGDNCPLIGGLSICPLCPLPLKCHQRCSEPDQDILSCDMSDEGDQ